MILHNGITVWGCSGLQLLMVATALGYKRFRRWRDGSEYFIISVLKRVREKKINTKGRSSC